MKYKYPPVKVCSVCRQVVHVNKTGLITKHGNKKHRCSGSGKPPVEITVEELRKAAAGR
jgi:hypothetical protein